MSTTIPTEPLLRADELAKLLRCGKSSVYALARDNKIPFINIGETGVRFDRAAVLMALQQPRPQRPVRKQKPK